LRVPLVECRPRRALHTARHSVDCQAGPSTIAGLLDTRLGCLRLSVGQGYEHAA